MRVIYRYLCHLTPQNLVVLNPKMYLRKTSQIRKNEISKILYPVPTSVDLKRGCAFTASGAEISVRDTSFTR